MEKIYTILLCEDDKSLSQIYTFKLEIEGFRVFQVTSGEHVIPKIKELCPDLIILDIVLPNKSGFEILRDLAEDENINLKLIPVLVLTNLSQQPDIDMAKGLGALEFLVKLHSTPHDVVEKVRWCLERGAHRREMALTTGR
jgi:two-component system, OmpR family, response regulator